MKVCRESLLKVLAVAAVGATPKEVLEQSDCFLFTDNGRLLTFNGDIFTSSKSPIPEVTGAIPHREFLQTVQKFPDEYIHIEQKLDEIQIRGKGRAAGIISTKGIQTPFAEVPKPSKMKALPTEFLGSLVQASRVCGTDETRPFTTAVHITPKMVEACDNFRLFRTIFKTGIQKELLVPAHSIAQVSGVVFEKGSSGNGWLHLQAKTGTRVSIRCLNDEYPDLSMSIKMGRHDEVKLPKSLKDIISRADVMRDVDLGEQALVSVTIAKGRFTIRTRKDSGWFRESKSINYDGRDLSFQVHPKLLQEVVAKARKVLVDDRRMCIRDRTTTFVVSLQVAE